MFQYFPENYPWSLSVDWATDCTGTFSEIHDAIQHLKPLAAGDSRTGGQTWYTAWSDLAACRLRTARAAEARGFRCTAGRGYFRAGVYQTMAVRFLPIHDHMGRSAYEMGVGYFMRGLQYLGKPAVAVNVPYQSGSLPGILALPQGDGPWPCVIFFGGFDSLKEWIYPLVVGPFLARGMGVFVVDQAGVGGALRLHGLPGIPEAERSATACIDVLSSMGNLDARRIGLAGISLGGYYAPRAAAFEKRIAACCAWGGIWELGPLFDRYAAEVDKPRSIPDMFEYAKAVFGTKDAEGALAVARRMTLANVIDRVTCPLLVVHGANDRQVSEGVSELTVKGAVNSPRAELRVFDLAEGGAEHCQIDNTALAADFMADWFAEVLTSDGAGQAAPQGRVTRSDA